MVELGCGPSVSGVSKAVASRRELQVKTEWTTFQSIGAMSDDPLQQPQCVSVWVSVCLCVCLYVYGGDGPDCLSTQERGLATMSAQIPPPSQQ
jgi:hypothetical protein